MPKPLFPVNSSPEGIAGNSGYSPSRRGLIAGLAASALAAPAIVRAASLMAVRPVPKILTMWIGGARISVEIYDHSTASDIAAQIDQQLSRPDYFFRSIQVRRNSDDPSRIDVVVPPDVAAELRIVSDIVERNLELSV